MNFPRDYILKRGTPFYLCLAVVPKANYVRRHKLMGFLRSAAPETHNMLLNADITSGNNATHQRNGTWEISEHLHREAALAKAQWIMDYCNPSEFNKDRMMWQTVQRIVYGEIDDKKRKLWSGWSYDEWKRAPNSPFKMT